MHLTLNGRPHDHRGDGSLAALLAELRADPVRVAVMINGNVITRDRRAEARLAEGDVVEVLTLAGGG